jgi:RNA polymerase sigma-70 factor (ECF subfamily)
MRLPGGGDLEAWQEFTAIYQPLVYRLARAKGFQDADAQEIVQEVLLAVSRAAGDWVPDKSRGKFRTWLHRVARNLMINFLTRKKYHSLGTGDSRIAELLHEQHDPASAESVVFDLEYRRSVFQWAAQAVQEQVSEKTWRAFRQTLLEDRPIADVARELGMTPGAVYIARSRVMARLRDVVVQHERSEETREHTP